MDSTSVSLLQRLRQPDQEAAWRRFVDLYAPLVFHWGRTQGLDATDAADLVQEVMSVMVVQLPEFEYDPQRRFRGWLRTVAVNKARDFQRRRNVRPAAGLEATVERTAVADSVDPFDEVEYRGLLARRALELMKGEFRESTWQACWMLVIEQRKAAEVAQMLGLTLNSVYLAKSRVLGRLREELEGLID